jgi:putative phosphoesterase
MKILVFTDTHNSPTAEKRIVDKIIKHKPDLLLCCGDFTIFMNHIDFFFKKFNKFKIKTFILHGNHEDEEIVNKLSKKYKYIDMIHNKIIKYNDLLIMGYGGGGFSITDPDFKKAEIKFEKLINQNQNIKKIMMLHQPPYNSGIDHIYGAYVGNKTTKKFIKKNKIDYVFAGHLHETSGKEHKTRSTIYINPGPWGKIITIDEK